VAILKSSIYHIGKVSPSAVGAELGFFNWAPVVS